MDREAVSGREYVRPAEIVVEPWTGPAAIPIEDSSTGPRERMFGIEIVAMEMSGKGYLRSTGEAIVPLMETCGFMVAETPFGLRERVAALGMNSSVWRSKENSKEPFVPHDGQAIETWRFGSGIFMAGIVRS